MCFELFLYLTMNKQHKVKLSFSSLTCIAGTLPVFHVKEYNSMPFVLLFHILSF